MMGSDTTGASMTASSMEGAAASIVVLAVTSWELSGVIFVSMEEKVQDLPGGGQVSSFPSACSTVCCELERGA